MTRRNSVSSGERLSIPAGEYNALLALLRRDADIATRDGREPFDNTKVWVRNNGATAKARWEPIGISEAIGIDPAQDSSANFDAVLLNGEVPNLNDHRGKFGICYDPIAPGKIGRVVIAGTTWAKLTITDDGDRFAEVEEGVGTYLKTGSVGSAQLIWKQAGAGGGKYGLVRLGPPASATGVPFRNDFSFSVPPGGIMAPYSSATIGGSEYVLCSQPSPTFHRRWLVNGQSSVASGATGLGSWLDDLSGFAAIDPGSAPLIGSARGWGPRPDSWLLWPAYFGFTIPGATTYTAEGYTQAHARQHEVNYLIGARLVSELAYNASAPVIIWNRSPGRTRRETNFSPLTVYDGMKLRTGDTIAARTRLDIVWNGDAWELANAACAEEDQTQSQSSYASSYGDSISPYYTSAPPSSPYSLSF